MQSCLLSAPSPLRPPRTSRIFFCTTVGACLIKSKWNIMFVKQHREKQIRRKLFFLCNQTLNQRDWKCFFFLGLLFNEGRVWMDLLPEVYCGFLEIVEMALIFIYFFNKKDYFLLHTLIGIYLSILCFNQIFGDIS